MPAAGQLPAPKLGLGIDNFPVSGPPAGSFVEDSMTMARLGISQEVPNAAKRRARSSRARTDVQAAEATFLSESRSEEHTSELQSLMRISYAVFCLKKKNYTKT